LLAVLFLLVAVGAAGYFWWENNNTTNVVERAPVTETSSLDTVIKPTLSPEQKAELARAKTLLTNNQVVEALAVYRLLSLQKVPEAMFVFGELALQEKNTSINCKQGFDLIAQAAEKGHTPAKRTLGIIYSFADDPKKLEQYNYHNRCFFSRNIMKGSKFLVEAMLEGDNAASKLLDTLNNRSAATVMPQDSL
jgi:TPR repeat protein